MSTEIEQNQRIVLNYLYEKAELDGPDYWVQGFEIHTQLRLNPDQINVAVDLLNDYGWVEVLRTMGTTPYHFNRIRITSRGRYEIQQRNAIGETIDIVSGEVISTIDQNAIQIRPLPNSDDVLAITIRSILENFIDEIRSRTRSPVGSPYGFEDEDWEIVSSRKNDRSNLYVTFGLKFESQHYNTPQLRSNIESMFSRTLQRYNEVNDENVALPFINLSAEYGGHLFNAIARDILSSDIAVFDTSNLAPNVFLEIGVALTWGSRVLLIKENSTERPASDVSGHTFANYRNNGLEFIGDTHEETLYRMVERAIQKKTP